MHLRSVCVATIATSFLLCSATVTVAVPGSQSLTPSPSPSPLGTLRPYVAHPPPAAAPPQCDLPKQVGWDFSRTPPFCKPLIVDPKPLTSTCRRDPDSLLCSNGKAQMFSQMLQDHYLFKFHFSWLRRRGIYADVAANHPTHISNTYFFDACLGWSGVCVEAHPQFLSGLYRGRTCAMVPTCVSDQDGTSVIFSLQGGLSGIAKTNKNADDFKKKGLAVSSIRMVCTTMEVALGKHDVSVIDYLSLDVEGHELSVLKGFNWEKVRINVMTVECQENSINEIETYLHSKGYVRHYPLLNERARKSGKLYEDAVFLHNSVKFGYPV